MIATLNTLRRVAGYRTIGGLLALVAILALPAHGQGVVSGSVLRDDGTALGGALVVLDPGMSSYASTRTDSLGRFHFSRVKAGDHVVRAISVGYRPAQVTVTVGRSSERIVLELTRLPQLLAAVRVEAELPGIEGLVVERDLVTPIPGVTLEFLNSRVRATTDSLGQFRLRGEVTPGPHLVYVDKARYQSRVQTVTVMPDSILRHVLVLDSLARGGMLRAMPMAEFKQRTRWMGVRTGLLTADDFRGREGMGLADALRASPAFHKRGLRLHDAVACVYVDGQQQQNVSANIVEAGEIEAVEVYGVNADYAGTADLRRRGPCGDGTLPPGDVAPGGASALGTRRRRGAVRGPTTDNYVRAVYVWLQR